MMEFDIALTCVITELYYQLRNFFQAPSQAIPNPQGQPPLTTIIFGCIIFVFFNQRRKQSLEKLNNLLIVTKSKNLGLSIFQKSLSYVFFLCAAASALPMQHCPSRAHFPMNILEFCSRMKLNYLEIVWSFLVLLLRIVRQVQICV